MKEYLTRSLKKKKKTTLHKCPNKRNKMIQGQQRWFKEICLPTYHEHDQYGTCRYKQE